ncbi:MAG: hypothetical protein ACRD18_08640 [Terriglobia bacterium]
MQCERCNAVVAMLIFAPKATDPGHFEDYARKMYPEYTRLNLPAWIIGPALGDGPLMDRPADILKIWPAREPIRCLRPAEFNPIVDELATRHCDGNAAPKPTAEQLKLASEIDTKVREFLRSGSDDITILKEMYDFMPDFKRLLLDSPNREKLMDELCHRHVGFLHYAKILETLAGAIASGEIKVPR